MLNPQLPQDKTLFTRDPGTQLPLTSRPAPAPGPPGPCPSHQSATHQLLYSQGPVARLQIPALPTRGQPGPRPAYIHQETSTSSETSPASAPPMVGLNTSSRSPGLCSQGPQILALPIRGPALVLVPASHASWLACAPGPLQFHTLPWQDLDYPASGLIPALSQLCQGRAPTTSKSTLALGHFGPFSQWPQDPIPPTSRLTPASSLPGLYSQPPCDPTQPHQSVASNLCTRQGPPSDQPAWGPARPSRPLTSVNSPQYKDSCTPLNNIAL